MLTFFYRDHHSLCSVPEQQLDMAKLALYMILIILSLLFSYLFPGHVIAHLSRLQAAVANFLQHKELPFDSKVKLNYQYIISHEKQTNINDKVYMSFHDGFIKFSFSARTNCLTVIPSLYSLVKMKLSNDHILIIFVFYKIQLNVCIPDMLISLFLNYINRAVITCTIICCCLADTVLTCQFVVP